MTNVQTPAVPPAVAAAASSGANGATILGTIIADAQNLDGFVESIVGIFFPQYLPVVKELAVLIATIATAAHVPVPGAPPVTP